MFACNCSPFPRPSPIPLDCDPPLSPCSKVPAHLPSKTPRHSNVPTHTLPLIPHSPSTLVAVTPTLCKARRSALSLLLDLLFLDRHSALGLLPDLLFGFVLSTSYLTSPRSLSICPVLHLLLYTRLLYLSVYLPLCSMSYALKAVLYGSWNCSLTVPTPSSF